MAAIIATEVSTTLRKAEHVLRLAMDAALQGQGLTTPQYEVLSALNAQPGLSGAALAKRCFVTPQTITGVIRNLEIAGLVARAADPENRRVIRTRLTAQGADVVARAKTLVAAIEVRMLADLDRAEREALADLLTQCADALKGAR
ncbi:MAG: MarR family winged helix-turn-helix transcriptional regulator [Xanthobacteraceae bacterium]